MCNHNITASNQYDGVTAHHFWAGIFLCTDVLVQGFKKASTKNADIKQCVSKELKIFRQISMPDFSSSYAQDNLVLLIYFCKLSAN